jgi:NADH-quinone oxidoreductase subunit E
MLIPEEKHEIAAEFPRYEQKRAVSLEALKIAQRTRGWISDETLSDVAEYLELTPGELDDVATFYNLIFRRAVGRHVILLCDSVSCWVMGYENLRDWLCSRLGIQQPGQTSSDNRFTLLPNVCLGCCGHAPAMMIDEDLYLDLTPEKIETILNCYA